MASRQKVAELLATLIAEYMFVILTTPGLSGIHLSTDLELDYPIYMLLPCYLYFTTVSPVNKYNKILSLVVGAHIAFPT